MENNVKEAIDFICDKSLLLAKNKTLLQLFSSENINNQITYSRPDFWNKNSVKKLVLNIENQNSCYVEFVDPIKEFGEDYVEMELSDLHNYSKLQLILLYQGWRIYDGISSALFCPSKDLGFCYKNEKPYMCSLPKFSLPYKSK